LIETKEALGRGNVVCASVSKVSGGLQSGAVTSGDDSYRARTSMRGKGWRGTEWTLKVQHHVRTKEKSGVPKSNAECDQESKQSGGPLS